MSEPKPPEHPQGGGMELMPLSENGKRLKAKYDALFTNHPDSMINIHEDITAYVRKLRTKYSDCSKRAVIHIISGSSLPLRDAASIIDEDFKGEDSVEAFLDSLTEKYKGIS